MNYVLRVPLQTSATQSARLQELQKAFAQVCNALAPVAQRTACWNRVALHHMAYKQLRQQFPGLGSQMVCNAIYSVSRACRHVYQHPQSRFNVQRLGGRPLPRLQFQSKAPVYFDRHTLSLKDGKVSMFTLDGRMRFNLALAAADEQRFRNEKLREIVLTSHGDAFRLSFFFAPGLGDEDAELASGARAELPEYVLVTEDNAPALPLPALPALNAHSIP